MIEEGFNANKLYIIHNSLAYEQQIEILQEVKNEYTRPFFLFFCISNELDSILQLRDTEKYLKNLKYPSYQQEMK